MDRVTPLWKFIKFSKITEFQNSLSSFFASVSPVYCKKIWLDSNKTDGGDRFWNMPLRQPPADQMVCTRWKRSAAPVCSSSRRAAPACSNRSSAGIPNCGHSERCWHSELEAQLGRKNQPAFLWMCVYQWKRSLSKLQLYWMYNCLSVVIIHLCHLLCPYV